MSAVLGLERKDASHFQPLSQSVSQPHISETRRTRGEECVANLKHTVLPAARSPSWKGPRLESHSTATFSFSSPPRVTSLFVKGAQTKREIAADAC